MFRVLRVLSLFKVLSVQVFKCLGVQGVQEFKCSSVHVS